MNDQDPTGNLVIEHLRAIRARMDSTGDDVYEIKVRVGLLESGMADLNASVALLHQRFDRTGTRFDRIERRLNLSDGPQSG